VEVTTHEVPGVVSGNVAEWEVPAGLLVEGQEYTFVVAAGDGTLWSEWSAEKAFVAYQEPSAPTGARTSSPTSVCVTGAGQSVINSTTPVLRAVLADPDGGNVQGEFRIYDVATGSPVWEPELTTARGSGSEHSIAVPAGTLTEGVAYEWRVRAEDLSEHVGPPVSCKFVVELTAPAEPGVAPVTGQLAVYTEDETSGGVGVAGQFEFTNGGSTDVVAYRYSFDGDDLGSQVVAASPVVTFTPTAPGARVLYVQSVDAAGWASPVRRYRFNVAFGG
jgi:hypothetical protein